MKRLLITLVAVGVLVTATWWFTKSRVGDVRPALLPSRVKVANLVDNLQLPDGFKAGVFASDLGKVRDLQLSPGGTLLASLQDAGQVVALPDKNQDGQADGKKIIVDGLRNAHGLAFKGSQLFVASETAVTRYDWDESSSGISHAQTILELPAGGRHVTRSMAFNADKLYVSLGSTCDVCVEKHPWVGAVIETDTQGRNPTVFAKGLRNAVFLTQNQDKVWATEMGRDFLGDNLPPDEVNSLEAGQDYGWPNCYGNKVADSRFAPGSSCSATKPPAYELPAHSAPLGLRFIEGEQFKQWQGDLLVGLHGSWNSSVPVGYKVIRIDTKTGQQSDFISGFLSGSSAMGRPVDLEFDSQGSLYLSDDKAGVIYKIARP